MPGNAVVIVAAGRGERIGGKGGPKQYRLLAGTTILQHTVSRFLEHPKIDAVKVVIHPDDHALYRAAVTPHEKLLSPARGGVTRQASCRAGICSLVELKPEKVLIHDAARPFVSAALIDNVLSGISANTGSLPAVAVADTIKLADEQGVVGETVSRKNLFLAQTPQGFFWQEILDAHQRAEAQTDTEFTDDAAVAEWAGMAVRLVGGDADNFKITTAGDLARAEARMTDHPNLPFPDIRVGNGYDVHTLGPGDCVVLGGIKIPHDRALQGHSDADVVLHSLTDALLGTIGAGDIGSHFPPSDPQWRGASSDRFIAHAVELVRSQGGQITCLDVTIICEAPKIGPHREHMRGEIARICGINPARVSVKATTNEKIGFVGRGEGIAALATATVFFGQQMD